MLDDVLLNLVMFDLGVMLGGNDHGVHPHWLSDLFIFDRDLRFSIGAQVFENPLFAHFGQAHCQLMGQHDGQGHQLCRFLAGEPHHHALVPCPARIHAHRNIGTLLIDGREHRAGLGIEAIGGIVVTNLADRLTHDLGNVHISFGGDLAGDQHKTCGHQGLRGHTAHGVLGENRVQNAIRNLVRDLIRVPLGDGFGSEEEGHRFLFEVLTFKFYTNLFIINSDYLFILKWQIEFIFCFFQSPNPPFSRGHLTFMKVS